MLYSIDEIFEMAEQLERNGGQFYRLAAESVTDTTNQKMLLELAAMEDEHERTFHKMRLNIAEQDSKTVTFDPEGLAARYLQALVDGEVFDLKSGPSELLKLTETMEDILQIAIGLEKDSIIFYLGIKEALEDPFTKETIDKIIQQEMDHITTLSKKLTSL
jgi:rubrerythrin